MGQKVNPISFRLSNRKDWSSYWYTSYDAAKLLGEDLFIRDYLEGSQSYFKNTLGKVQISREVNSSLLLHTLSQEQKNYSTLLSNKKIEVKLQDLLSASNILFKDNSRSVDSSASIIANRIAEEFERGSSFRQISSRLLRKENFNGYEGVKIVCSGCLRGADRAQKEVFKFGSLSPQTIVSNIDYVFKEAHTNNGLYGIKVWLSLKKQKESSSFQKKLFIKLLDKEKEDRNLWYLLQNRRSLKRPEKVV